MTVNPLIKKLRDLAEHPLTPHHEAVAAMKRAMALEKRDIEEERNKRRLERQAEEDARLAAEAAAKKAAPAPEKKRVIKFRKKTDVMFETEWPFGWEKRDPGEVESLAAENGIVVGFKCSSCEMHVERLIPERWLVRQSVKAGWLQQFLSDMRSGKVNRLCDKCNAKYQ